LKNVTIIPNHSHPLSSVVDSVYIDTSSENLDQNFTVWEL